MAIKPPPLNPSPILESPRTITALERRYACDWLKKQHQAGNLPAFDDVEGDTLELFIDMLGLNDRQLRDTVPAKRRQKE